MMNVSFKSAQTMGNSNVQSGNTVKTIGKVLVGSALLAGGLAVAAKTGKLDYSGHNKFASAVLNTAKTVGTKIADVTVALKNKVLKGGDAAEKALKAVNGRNAQAVELYNKSVAAKKLAKAQEALKEATTHKAIVGIHQQIEKLTKIVNG